MSIKADGFRKEIEKLIIEAKDIGCEYIDITSGDVHRSIGGYPSSSHAMPVCCDVMYSMKKVGDEIINQPPKGKGATLTIRYKL
ncbi:HNH endonuclease [Clostridium gasigenes]|uniref:HNH endonuclease n=1 Tax=Clostridium gasigenes TaxID=94869 RepID=A0A7X0VSN9_9CLOT|nr:HNH endonuclease [Clostridium gasigenes]MBB6714796.1 HNH endonuclease [Clostridium gasigenes]